MINRKVLLDLFGAATAAEAILAIEIFEEVLGIGDCARYPDLESGQVRDAKQKTIDKLHDYGYYSTYQFEGYINKWVMFKNGADIASLKAERTSYEPVDIGSAFHNGRLYYPVQTLLKTYIGSGISLREAECIDIVVVRSDRTLQRIEESFDEKGRPSGIYRLTDGTLLQKRPTASAHATWSWTKIQDYLNSKYTRKSLSFLSARIYKHLRSRVWLANDADYWLLTFAAIASYAQPVFEAVPLILLHGQPGTGKSELGAAMTEVSCNSVMIGQTSAPTMLRLMDECKGLVVIDDLESIGITGATGKEKFSEMVQVLKVSYKKASATKIITNPRRETEVMNFFGIKIVSNTKGVDAILGSRMIHISTQNIGQDDLEDFLSRRGLSSRDLEDLKNDLHIWTFDNVDKIYSEYMQQVSGSMERDEEIAAPLLVMAKLSEIPGVYELLESTLADQKQKKVTFRSPILALDHVMEKMAKNGIRRFTLIEVSLRLRQILGVGDFKKRTTPSWSKSEWISKRLRETGWLGTELKRKNMFGYQAKVFSISEDKRIERGIVGLERQGPFDFCSGCVGCPYRSLHCEILPYRAKKEGL